MKTLYSIIWVAFDIVGYIIDSFMNMWEELTGEISYDEEEEISIMAHTGDW